MATKDTRKRVRSPEALQKHAERMRQWRIVNRQLWLQRNRDWYAKHSDRLREQRAKTPELYRKKSKQWRLNNLAAARTKDARGQRRKRVENPKYAAEVMRRCRLRNPDRNREACQRYFAKHGERIREASRKAYAANVGHYRSAASMRRAAKQNPKWADKTEIRRIYRDCPNGYHVDHIVPLKGVTREGWRISGLHVPWNLQYLPADENCRKGNRYDGDAST